MFMYLLRVVYGMMMIANNNNNNKLNSANGQLHVGTRALRQIAQPTGSGLAHKAAQKQVFGSPIFFPKHEIQPTLRY